MTNNQDTFAKELRKITGLSVEYCISAFHTLTDFKRKTPKKAAEYYKKRFDL